MRLWPCASATFIDCTGVDGSAMKKRLNGMVVPFPYVGPTESGCTAGRKTPSAVRYGGSCETGVAGTVVYWFVPGPKLVAGAPLSPRNTWFQTPFDHCPMLLLRVKNCCCPKFPTNPFSSSLAKNPPLTKP